MQKNTVRILAFFLTLCLAGDPASASLRNEATGASLFSRQALMLRIATEEHPADSETRISFCRQTTQQILAGQRRAAFVRRWDTWNRLFPFELAVVDTGRGAWPVLRRRDKTPRHILYSQSFDDAEDFSAPTELLKFYNEDVESVWVAVGEIHRLFGPRADSLIETWTELARYELGIKSTPSTPEELLQESLRFLEHIEMILAHPQTRWILIDKIVEPMFQLPFAFKMHPALRSPEVLGSEKFIDLERRLIAARKQMQIKKHPENSSSANTTQKKNLRFPVIFLLGLISLGAWNAAHHQVLPQKETDLLTHSHFSLWAA